jgi:hypothetical protein
LPEASKVMLIDALKDIALHRGKPKYALAG